PPDDAEPAPVDSWLATEKLETGAHVPLGVTQAVAEMGAESVRVGEGRADAGPVAAQIDGQRHETTPGQGARRRGAGGPARSQRMEEEDSRRRSARGRGSTGRTIPRPIEGPVQRPPVGGLAPDQPCPGRFRLPA